MNWSTVCRPQYELELQLQVASVINCVSIFFLFWGGVEPSPLLLRPLFGLLYQPRMVDDDECGTIGEMHGRGNRSTRRKPAAVLLYPPQILYDMTRA
jgi:hypothetical protein